LKLPSEINEIKVLPADQQSRDVGTESFWYRFPSVPSTIGYSSFNKTPQSSPVISNKTSASSIVIKK